MYAPYHIPAYAIPVQLPDSPADASAENNEVEIAENDN
jgi:hypothetical protein